MTKKTIKLQKKCKYCGIEYNGSVCPNCELQITYSRTMVKRMEDKK